MEVWRSNFFPPTTTKQIQGQAGQANKFELALPYTMHTSAVQAGLFVYYIFIMWEIFHREVKRTCRIGYAADMNTNITFQLSNNKIENDKLYVCNGPKSKFLLLCGVV